MMWEVFVTTKVTALKKIIGTSCEYREKGSCNFCRELMGVFCLSICMHGLLVYFCFILEFNTNTPDSLLLLEFLF
jgi:hypothetical protein